MKERRLEIADESNEGARKVADALCGGKFRCQFSSSLQVVDGSSSSTASAIDFEIIYNDDDQEGDEEDSCCCVPEELQGKLFTVHLKVLAPELYSYSQHSQQQQQQQSSSTSSTSRQQQDGSYVGIRFPQRIVQERYPVRAGGGAAVPRAAPHIAAARGPRTGVVLRSRVHQSDGFLRQQALAGAPRRRRCRGRRAGLETAIVVVLQ